MTLHCTKLTLDHWPFYITDPLSLKQYLIINSFTLWTVYPENSIWLDEMTLHCTKLTLDHWPLYITDPLSLEQHLIMNSFTLWTDYPENNIWLDEMTLHCTKLTLDTKPMLIMDPLPTNNTKPNLEFSSARLALLIQSCHTCVLLSDEIWPHRDEKYTHQHHKAEPWVFVCSLSPFNPKLSYLSTTLSWKLISWEWKLHPQILGYI